ncbi:MAG: transporter substrate-binding domain-containing protein [Deltaproteobacteria bacterium]|nr:transporter substrate-binding domain-containing protein [Deltaproteobacteria bacterium]
MSGAREILRRGRARGSAGRRLLTACLLLAAAWGRAAAGSELRMGYFEAAPNLLVVAGRDRPSGPVAEYCEAFAKKMGMGVTWVGPAPIPRLFRMLRTGEIDAIALLTKASGRETLIAYPEQPLYTMRPVLCLLASDGLKEVRRWDDLKQRRVGVQYGTFLSRILGRDAPSLNLIQIHQQNTPEKGIEFLKRGNLEAFLYPDQTAIEYHLRKQDVSREIRVVPAPVPPRPVYVAFTATKPELVKMYNRYSRETSFDRFSRRSGRR